MVDFEKFIFRVGKMKIEISLPRKLNPLIQFYKLESKFWKQLYRQQRGGRVFDDLQKELVETKKELSQYKKGLDEVARCGCTDGHCPNMAYDALNYEKTS
jgi:hypothetical protein